MKQWITAFLTLASAAALAQAPPVSQAQRLRGAVESFDGSTLVVKVRGGEVVRLGLSDKFAVSEVLPIAMSSLQAGSYVGSAATTEADGTLRALEVLVFPEAARGTAEGHSAWDLQPGSTMTNATVSEAVVGADGRTLKLKYQGGEKTLVVPADVPIVTLKPGDRALLVPGAKLLVNAQVVDGKPTAMRALVGRDGFAPPM